jgi:membrane associated rhomboid family serine protease
MFLPYSVEVDVERTPTANLWIIGITLLCFLGAVYGPLDPTAFVLDGFNPSLITHAFMHAGFFHLLGNLAYLWIFGNAICARLGSITFPAVYLFLAFSSGVVHLLLDGDPVVGASGAVSGIIGIFLFWYPKSTVNCAWTVLWAAGKTFQIRAYWLISLWLVKDIVGFLYSNAPVAYAAHVGGLVVGFVAGLLMLKYRWVEPDRVEPDLGQLLRKASPEATVEGSGR